MPCLAEANINRAVQNWQNATGVTLVLFWFCFQQLRLLAVQHDVCWCKAIQLHFERFDSADRGEEAILRSVQQLQEASQPLYNNLFIPFSNQPNGDFATYDYLVDPDTHAVSNL